MITIFTVNVNSPSESRARRQLQALMEGAAEVIVLTEVKDSPGGRVLATGLRADGYHVIGWDDQGFDGFTTLVASKVAFEASSSDASRVQTITLNTEPGICLRAAYGISSDPFGRNSEEKIRAKRDWLDAFVEGSRRAAAAGSLLILGDLNIVDDRDVRQYQSLYDFERVAYATLIAMPMRDLLRSPEDYSWISHQGQGFRFDHALVSPRLAEIVGTSTYDHEWRSGPDKLTDHSAVLVQLDVSYESLDGIEPTGPYQATLF